MSFTPPLKFGYALLVVQGLVSLVVPRKAIALATSAWRLGFENVGDLEPREWYVDATRVAGIGMLVAGLAGLALAGTDEETSLDADAAPSTGDGDGDGDGDADADDEDGGPVRVDID